MIAALAARGLDRRMQVFVALVLALGVLVPTLNLLVPAGSPFHLSTYVVTLVGKYLC